MLGRDKTGTELAGRERPGDERPSSNIKLLLIATAFLFVAIGVLVVLPDADRVAAPQVAAVPDAPAPDAEVSRGDASLLTFETLPASEAVSRQLRQPIRLTDSNANHSDLRKMAASVLADFGHVPQQGDPLLTLLVQALSEGQSNAYIDALLNTAAARGEFTPPRQLVDATGRMNTEALLVALVRQAQS